MEENDNEPETLHPLVREIVDSFYMKDGKLVIDPEVASERLTAIGRVPPVERETVAVHLTMVAQKMKAEAGPEGLPAVEPAIMVLIVYMGMVGIEREAINDLIEKAGLQNEAAAVVGSTEVVRAPAAQLDAPSPKVKAKRGLKKD